MGSIGDMRGMGGMWRGRLGMRAGANTRADWDSAIEAEGP